MPISLVLACGSEGQDGSTLPQEVASFVAVPLASAQSCGHAARTHIGQGTLYKLASIHLLSLPHLSGEREASAVEAKAFGDTFIKKLAGKKPGF